MMRRLLVYLLFGLAAGLLFFFFVQRLATNLKASIETYQEQHLEQMDWEYENVNKRLIEQEEIYQEQLKLIESYADIVTETEADYLERMGRHSPYYKEILTQLSRRFPHVTPIELWDLIYERELDHLDEHGRISQRILDQIKESREQAEAVERIFGDLKEQSKCQ